MWRNCRVAERLGAVEQPPCIWAQLPRGGAVGHSVAAALQHALRVFSDGFLSL